mmetsp:Transcript_20224/g.58615  ORF Transcript_20224/g.58615 Transcript_20224/m.58615 type:complete len:250 (-) Transcript_20224:2559-3308(-)
MEGAPAEAALPPAGRRRDLHVLVLRSLVLSHFAVLGAFAAHALGCVDALRRPVPREEAVVAEREQDLVPPRLRLRLGLRAFVGTMSQPLRAEQRRKEQLGAADDLVARGANLLRQLLSFVLLNELLHPAASLLLFLLLLLLRQRPFFLQRSPLPLVVLSLHILCLHLLPLHLLDEGSARVAAKEDHVLLRDLPTTTVHLRKEPFRRVHTAEVGREAVVAHGGRAVQAMDEHAAALRGRPSAHGADVPRA